MQKPSHGGVVSLDVSSEVFHDTISGGDGNVIAFHDNNGRLLTHCKAVLVFWGSAWTKPSTTPSASTFTTALEGIVGGPWSSKLAQYRGIGPMSIEQTSMITVSDPPLNFTNANIQAMLTAQIDNGTLPAPDNAVDRVYCVLMPAGFSSGDTTFVGQHQFFDRNGTRAYYAWITNDGSLTGGNSIPKIFSHEMAERASDPNLGNPDSGILLDVSLKDTNEEIGDVCNNTFSIVNGVAIQSYWSQEDRACVLPTVRPVPSIEASITITDPGHDIPGSHLPVTKDFLVTGFGFTPAGEVSGPFGTILADDQGRFSSSARLSPNPTGHGFHPRGGELLSVTDVFTGATASAQITVIEG
jgi:hypothetical protein